jgi:hypothetical protein
MEMLEGGTIIFNVKKRIGFMCKLQDFIYLFIYFFHFRPMGLLDLVVSVPVFTTYLVTTQVNPQLFIGTHYPPTISLNGPDAKCPRNGRMSISHAASFG